MPLRNSLGLAALVLFLDQLTKLWVLAKVPLHGGFELTGFFNLVHVRNSGAAFSFLAGEPGWQRFFFIALALTVSLVLLHLLRKPAPRPTHAAYALVLGGAVGNLIDRLMHGNVVDFLDFHAAGWHWPAFNVADSAISLGAAWLVWISLRQPSP